jgi:hypothetical protein
VKEQQTYGTAFLKHLTELSRQTPYNYTDLQQIKAMDREALAERLKSECPKVSEFVMENSAQETAELVHKRRMEIVAATSRGSAAQGAASLLEFVVQLFGAAV